MKFNLVKIVSAVLIAAVVLLFSGCEFKTYIKTDMTPDSAVTGFFDSLKSKDFDGCGKYLANNGSFEIYNNTGYKFADVVLDKQIETLRYRIVGDPDIDGENASCRVQITSLDKSDIETAMASEYTKTRIQYITENNLFEFPIDDKEVVSEVAINTFNAVIDSVKPTQKDVTVSLKFQGDGWKIIVDEEFCLAILGGDA